MSLPATVAQWLLSPPSLITAGLALCFFGGLMWSALQQFSPARLIMRLQKAKKRSTKSLEELEDELDHAEFFLPPASILKFSGIACTIIGSLDLYPGEPGRPTGGLVFALIFLAICLVGEILPDRIASYRADQIVYRLLPVLRGLRIVLLPLTWPLMKLSRFFLRNVLGIRQEIEAAKEKANLADEIRAAVEDSDEEETLKDEEKDWIANIIDLRKADVAHVMTPRIDIIAIESARSFREAVEIATDKGHSRLPVFEDKLDNITGIFYVRDAVKLMAEEDKDVLGSTVGAHCRPPYFVPESKGVGDLLREFKSRRVQIAIVVDEYGGTAGLVSMEDIVEEIVGEIEDEYDPEEENPLKIIEQGKVAEIDAKVRIDDLNEALGIELPDSEDFETMGGFVFSQLGKIPKTGESLLYQNIQITVLSASDRKIEQLKIRVLQKEAAERTAT